MLDRPGSPNREEALPGPLNSSLDSSQEIADEAGKDPGAAPPADLYYLVEVPVSVHADPTSAQFEVHEDHILMTPGHPGGDAVRLELTPLMGQGLVVRLVNGKMRVVGETYHEARLPIKIERRDEQDEEEDEEEEDGDWGEGGEGEESDERGESAGEEEEKS
jgi:hypothetical protein